MTTTSESISHADLVAIRSSRYAAEVAAGAAKLAAATSRAASAEARVGHLLLAAKYNLGEQDTLDLDTGTITRTATQKPAPDAAGPGA